MMPQPRSLQSTEQPSSDELTRAWEANDYIDFMGAILLGVTLTALALSVM